MTDKIADRYALSKAPPLRGGMAEVRKAFDLEAESQVAVKLVHGIDEGDRLAARFFERESSLLSALQHPHIVRMVDAGRDPSDGSYYIVLEWIDRSLDKILAEPRTYSWVEFAAEIALPLADALAYAHVKHVEHRDIKPANVLITDTGQPKLADFGIAKLHEQLLPPDLTLAGYGSPPYAPPQGRNSDPYVRDVYSFGVLILRSLSSTSLGHRNDVERALNDVNVPPDVRRFLTACVDIDPSARPPDGAVLYQRLAEIVGSERSRHKARSNVVSLKLTRTAKGHLQGICREDGDDRTPEARLESDLSQGVHVEYRHDPEIDQLDLETIFVIGRDFRIVLKGGGDEPRYVVTSVRKQDAEQLDAVRNRSCQVDPILTWSCSTPRDLHQAESGMAALAASLDDHVEARERARQAAKDNKEQSRLFDQWLRLLDVREELARGQNRPVTYVGYKGTGSNVQFDLTDPVDRDLIGEEWEVSVPETQKRLTRGEVVRQTETTLTLLLPRRHPPLPTRGRLGPYLGPAAVALQRQREAIERIKNGAAVRPNVREMILSPSSISQPRRANLSGWCPDNLDSSKQEAVRYAVNAEDFVLIQGPPGTGKTAVITEIVRQYLQRDPSRRVLLVSQTHVAVDNALERLGASGMDGLVRLGQPDDVRIDPSVRDVMLDRQIDRWARKVRQRATDHLAGQARRHGIKPDHLRAALDLQQLATVLADMAIIEDRVEQTPHDHPSADLATSLAVAEDDIGTQERLDALAERRDELLAQARQHLDGDLSLSGELSPEWARCAVQAVLGPAQESWDLFEILRLQGEWLQRLTSDDDLAAAFLKTTRVVAGTCLGFLGHRALRDLDFDLCIMDEASKATATEALVPLARARRWVLVGDASQLPPMDEEILRSPERLAEHNLETSIAKTTLFDRLIDGTSHPVQHLLTEQYRMTRAIGDMISTCFYDGKLHSPRDQHIPGYHNVCKPVLWLDTRGLGQIRREDITTDGDNSAVNRTEAKLVIERLEILDQAIERRLIEAASGDLEILVIAPYRRQLEEISRRLTRFSPRHLKISIQSVDAAQGREADIAIFSVTRSNPQGRLGFLSEPYWRRINVALSRARYGLVVIGDADFCRSRPGALREVLTYIDGHPDDCEIRKADHVGQQ